MAKYLGVSRQTYINYENGNSEPSFESLIKISNILDASIDELLNNVEFIDRGDNRYTEILKSLNAIVKANNKKE